MKNVAIVFTENNARICINPPDIEWLKTVPNVVVNPDLSEVEKVEPHFWKLEFGKIKPMNAIERKHREDSLKKGVVNQFNLSTQKNNRFAYELKRIAIKYSLLILGVLLGYIVGFIVK